MTKREVTETVSHSEQYADNFEMRFKDPEPVSIILGVLAAVTAGAGLVVNYAQYRSQIRQERSQQQREEDERRRQIRRHVTEANRALDDLNDSYRRIVSIFDQEEIMMGAVSLGERPILADDAIIDELRYLRLRYTQAGANLEGALDNLADYVDEDMENRARDYAGELSQLFQNARTADRIVTFLTEVGLMLKAMGQFMADVSRRYRIAPTFGGQEALEATLNQMQQPA